MKTFRKWWLAVLPVLLLILLIPTSHHNVYSDGVDSYKTHYPLFGTRMISERLTLQRPITGVGVVAVDMLRTNRLTDIEYEVISLENHQPLAAGQIGSDQIIDDQFARVIFDNPVTAANVELVFRAPGATAQNPIGIRFDPSRNISGVIRLENGQQAPGTWAIEVTENRPLWEMFRLSLNRRQNQLWQIAASSGSAILLAFLSLQPGWRSQPPRIRRAIQLGIVVCLAALALNSRLYHISQLKGVSGGDPYNYLFITKNITEFKNPLQHSKRLPGYPLLLTPVYLANNIDDQKAMIVISSIFAAGSLILVSILARVCGLAWPVQLFTPAILAWQKDFYWTSIRPEPYTIFGFLLLACLILFISHRHKWQQYLFGVCLGYAAMTRQEGFLLAVLFFVGALFFWKNFRTRHEQPSSLLHWTRQIAPTLLRMFLPALAIVFPFFLQNTIDWGNPIYTPYFEGEKLQIVDSWHAFLDAVGATWGVLGSMWRSSWDQLIRHDLSSPAFAVFFFLLIFWWLCWQTKLLSPKKIIILPLTIISAGMFIWLTWWSSVNTGLASTYIPIMTAALLLAAVAPFLVRMRLPGAFILIILLSQVGIATWFHPFSKHYQQSYPLIVLMMSTALFAGTLARTMKSWHELVFVFSSRALLLLPFLLIASFLFNPGKITAAIDESNEDTAADYVVYRAIRESKKYAGPHGTDQPYLAARLYFGDDGYYYYGDEVKLPSSDEQRWLDEKEIRTMVTSNVNDFFDDLGTQWSKAAVFKSEGNNERLFESVVWVRK